MKILNIFDQKGILKENQSTIEKNIQQILKSDNSFNNVKIKNSSQNCTSLTIELKETDVMK